jgi:hypothetical protein
MFPEKAADPRWHDIEDSFPDKRADRDHQNEQYPGDRVPGPENGRPDIAILMYTDYP